MSRRDNLTGDTFYPASLGEGTTAVEPSEGETTEVSPVSPLLTQNTPRAGRDPIHEIEQGREVRDRCVELSRRASDAFKEACSSQSLDESDASYSSAKSRIEELWEYAHLRDAPFRDLLGLLDASIKRAELTDFTETQQEVLRQAFCDLPRWMLDETAVEGHIERFAEHDIDITGPLHAGKGKRILVSIKVIDEK